MALFLYRLLWCVLPSLLPLYLKKRGRSNEVYLLHWQERWGQPMANPVQNAIWVHAVSVGETQAALPLIRQLQQRFPNAPLLLTQMTPTGRAAAEKWFPEAQCRYLPYDHPRFVQQFLQEHQPIFGVLMETEIWVNLIHACHQQGVPVFLANARLSEKSQKGYVRFRSLFAPALRKLTGCFAQTREDAQRLASIGADGILVGGNTKYDVMPSAVAVQLGEQFRQKVGQRKVVLCASTRFYHDVDEAELLLRAWQDQVSDALLVVVPRHLERFEAVYQMAVDLGLKTQKRSDGLDIAADTQVWIGDSMGEMPAYYAMADMVFVGGSLVDSGCQNIIEPAAQGKPVVFGFSTYNFAQACRDALACGAAKQVSSAQEWREQVQYWLDNPAECERVAQQARQFVQQHQGASERMANWIAERVQRLWCGTGKIPNRN